VIPEELLYTKYHEWLRADGGSVVLGVTMPLVRRFSPIISVELPDVDDELMPEIAFGEVEGLHGTHQLHVPTEARVVAVNEEIIWDQRKLIKDPYGAGWLVRLEVENRAALEGLLDAEQYRALCVEEFGENFEDE